MRVQPKKIMCAVDFSDFTDETLAYSVAFCKEFHAKLFLAHIATDVNSSFVHSEIAIDRVTIQREYLANAQKTLEDMARKIAIENEIVVGKGDPIY